MEQETNNGLGFMELKGFEFKEISEDGSFKGIASVYGVEDLGGDVIEKGAFTKSISEKPVIPILWQHKSDEVIGLGEVKEWQGKLMIEGKLDLEDPTAAKAYRKIKSKLISGLSIGFTTVKSVWEEIEEAGASRWVRRIHELKLWETSIVTFPMLPAAQVTRVKSDDAVTHRIAELEKQVQALSGTKVSTSGEGTPVDPEAAAAERAASQKGVGLDPANFSLTIPSSL